MSGTSIHSGEVPPLFTWSPLFNLLPRPESRDELGLLTRGRPFGGRPPRSTVDHSQMSAEGRPQHDQISNKLDAIHVIRVEMLELQFCALQMLQKELADHAHQDSETSSQSVFLSVVNPERV